MTLSGYGAGRNVGTYADTLTATAGAGTSLSNYILTASNGTLRGKTPSTLPAKVPQAACPNRGVHGIAGGQTEKLKTARLTLKVPCAQVGDVTVNVTSATGPTSPYLQGSTTVAVAAADAEGCKPCVDQPPPRLPNPITGPKNATAANATDAAAANATAPATSAATSSSSAAAVVTVVAAAAAVATLVAAASAAAVAF